MNQSKTFGFTRNGGVIEVSRKKVYLNPILSFQHTDLKNAHLYERE